MNKSIKMRTALKIAEILYALRIVSAYQYAQSDCNSLKTLQFVSVKFNPKLKQKLGIIYNFLS